MNTVTEQYALQFVRKLLLNVFLIKYVFKKLYLGRFKIPLKSGMFTVNLDFN